MPASTTAARSRNGVKQPADHKPKVAAIGGPTKVVERTEETVTVDYRGLITLTIEAAALNDYELVEDFASEDAAAVPQMMNRLLGPEAVHDLKEALRTETGRVPLEGEPSISDFVNSLFGVLEEVAPS